MSGVKDETVPGARWEFDASVTDAFDDMLRRSIPSHDEMRRLCLSIGSRFVRQGTDVVDLGCSRGEAMAAFVDRFGATVRFTGVEVSEPMRKASLERFRGYVDAGVVKVRDTDLRKAYPPVKASLTLCVLTLQFVPIEHRQRLLRDAFRSTAPGGAFVLVEKVMGGCHESDALLADEYWRMKEANGYSRDQIERKRLSLEGVLVPVTARWNEDMLSAAGFRQVECFWRHLNFAGWVAVREEDR